MPDDASASLFSSLFQHVTCMPRWHRGTLMIALLLAAAGVMGRARQQIAGNTNTTAANATVARPHRSFAGNDGSPASMSADSPQQAQPWYLTPQFLNVGLSVIGGFVIGWFARAFIKTVTLLALAGGGILAALSYFHVINVDLSSANEQYSSAMHWLTDQASRLKDVAIAYLPVHAAGALGTFLGFQRK